MIALAVEELQHFEAVFRQLRQRQITLGLDEPDVYVKQMMPAVRHARREHLLDRLLISAAIEARSCERFVIAANGIAEDPLREFYAEFACAEGRHYELFIDTAKLYYPESEVEAR